MFFKSFFKSWPCCQVESSPDVAWNRDHAIFVTPTAHSSLNFLGPIKFSGIGNFSCSGTFSYPELRSSWPAPRIESSGQRSNTCACPWFSTSGLFPVQRCSARSINFNWCYGTSVNEIYHYLNDLDRILPRINEDPCGSKHKRGDPVWVKLVAYYTFIVVRWVINKLQMHFPVNSFSVSSAQRTSYVLFCFIWFWDGRVAFRWGLTIILAWYLRQFQVDRHQLKAHFVENLITCGEIKKILREGNKCFAKAKT